MAKGKKKVSWVLIIAVMFLIGGIMTLIEKIKESAHPVLFAVLIVVGLVAVAVCVFLILRHAKKKKDAAVDSVDIPDRAVPDSELKMANIDTTPLPSAEPVKPAETGSGRFLYPRKTSRTSIFFRMSLTAKHLNIVMKHTLSCSLMFVVLPT